MPLCSYLSLQESIHRPTPQRTAWDRSFETPELGLPKASSLEIGTRGSPTVHWESVALWIIANGKFATESLLPGSLTAIRHSGNSIFSFGSLTVGRSNCAGMKFSIACLIPPPCQIS